VCYNLQSTLQAGLKCVSKTNFHKFFNKHVQNPDLRDLLGRMKVLTATEEGMSEDEWEACFYYCAFVFKKPDTKTQEAVPRGYHGRQASRVHQEEDIVCFPGYGPEAHKVMDSPDPSPRLGPYSGSSPALSPRYTTF